MSHGLSFARRMLVALVLGSLAMVASAQDAVTVTKAAIQRADAAIAKIIAIPDAQRTFDNTLGALDDLSTAIDTETGLSIFMQNVSTDEKVRDLSREADDLISAWSIGVGRREDLYRAIKAYVDTNPKLEGEQKRFLEFTLRDYRRSGMDLPKEKRDRLTAIDLELQKLSTDFAKNIADDETTAIFPAKQLKGLPVDTLNRLAKGVGDLRVVTMDAPTYTTLQRYVENEDVRKATWLAYKRRGGKRNVRLLERILVLRNEMAGILGYKNSVDYFVETRMAKNSETIKKFYAELQPIVRKKATVDYALFTEAKRADTHDKKAVFYPWDYEYYNQRLLKSKYAVDTQKISEYFSVKQVFDGLFKITSSLYGIEFRDVTADAPKLGLPVWHPDVKLWSVVDKASGNELGKIYTDLFPRENKYNHAACWGLIPRKVMADGTVQKPLAALVCNFTKPTDDKPSLMAHSEVETFFHEFGHALHNVLTETHYGRFAGTAVARDFVEAPSQMFENWVWDPKVLSLFAKHYKTGEVLPLKTLEAMRAAETLGSGMLTEHQFYYGLVDQAYHLAPGGKVDTTKVGVDLLPQVELYPAPEGTFFQSSFGHLMGYSGAYYGYQWSLVYAQDMFVRFEEKGILNPEAGMYYRKKILSRGGTMDEMDMLRDYLGREPNLAAFLRKLGMDEKPSTKK